MGTITIHHSPSHHQSLGGLTGGSPKPRQYLLYELCHQLFERHARVAVIPVTITSTITKLILLSRSNLVEYSEASDTTPFASPTTAQSHDLTKSFGALLKQLNQSVAAFEPHSFLAVCLVLFAISIAISIAIAIAISLL